MTRVLQHIRKLLKDNKAQLKTIVDGCEKMKMKMCLASFPENKWETLVIS